MKIALVHDYLNEYGGAERVLRALADLWPDAPIYTAFKVGGSTAEKAFSDRKVITSWMNRVPFYKRLYSPLRFLIPLIWGSFDFSDYDLVITSASWYVTKGMKRGEMTKEICYCHTPPRWLYGYPTSVDWQKYKLVRIYGLIVGHILRLYDFRQAQKVDVFVANSQNVAARIKKFYRREAEVIYPPVVEPMLSQNQGERKHNYMVMVGRLVGGKGFELAAKAAKQLGFKLVIVGEAAGRKDLPATIREVGGEMVELTGYVSEEKKWEIVSNARALLALEKEVDFGITPMEAMKCGTPVLALDSGGFKETVKEGKTGLLISDYSVEAIRKALEQFEKIKWNRNDIKKIASEFGKEQFKKQMLQLVGKYAGTT